MPEFTIDDDIRHFIQEMETYLDHHYNLPEKRKWKIVQAGVKGEAKNVLMGYRDSEINTTKKIFKVLKQEFKRKEKCVVNLHQLKQDSNERVSIFAGRIRRYVRGLGVKGHKFDRTCIEYLKVGALAHLQNRLYQRDPRTFTKAIKIAIEAEGEKIGKGKKMVSENLNNMETKDLDASRMQEVQTNLKELCNAIMQQTKQLQGMQPNRQQAGQEMQPTRSYTYNDNKNRQTSLQKVGNGVRGACFHCGFQGHRYFNCYKATDKDRQSITERIDQYKRLTKDKYRPQDGANTNALQLSELQSCNIRSYGE